MDGSPMLYLDLVKLQELLNKKLIDPDTFCSLHNYMAQYISLNMLVPGQVERWIVILNVNHFSINKLPVKMFKTCAKELSANYMENTRRTVVVNLTFMQNAAAKLL